jgi:MFS transporter, UMF1 family
MAKPRPTPPARVTPTPGEIYAWVSYDWANSAYSTVLITVVLYYVQAVVLEGKVGAAAFAGCAAVSMFLAGVLSPIVGAMADANRNKRRWLARTALGGAAAGVLMSFVPPSATGVVLVLLVAMMVLFDLSLVPYNGFLQEVSDETTINRISAWGFALGYLGGAIPLGLAGLMVWAGPACGLPTVADQCRAGILLMGVWWGLFSLPAVFMLRDRGAAPARQQRLWPAARAAAREVLGTLRHIRRFPVIALFLVAYLFFNEGIQTVINQANTLALRDFHFSLLETIAFVFVIQLVALPSSLAVGWLSDRYGQKRTLLACLVVWFGLIVVAVLVSRPWALWAMGLVLAIVLGGSQSVSRALMGSITPNARAAEFFGFYNLSGKASSSLGPALFGTVIFISGSAKLAAASLLIFFLVGIALLLRVDVAAGARIKQIADAGKE